MSKHVSQKSLKELQEECRSRGMNAEETASRTDLMERIIVYDAGMREPDIPEAGYKRDEEMAQRKDELDERLDKIEDETGVFKVDPEAFEEDREILYKSIDQQMVEVSNKLPDHVYCWTYFGQSGQQVWAKKALGWQVVTGTDKECEEHKEADGSRRIGDTLLMRVPRERWERLEEESLKRRESQHLGVGSRLLDLAEKGRSHGLKVHGDISTVQVGNQTLMDVVEKRSGAHKTAMKSIDKKLRDGTVPGVSSPSDK